MAMKLPSRPGVGVGDGVGGEGDGVGGVGDGAGPFFLTYVSKLPSEPNPEGAQLDRLQHLPSDGRKLTQLQELSASQIAWHEAGVVPACAVASLSISVPPWPL